MLEKPVHRSRPNLPTIKRIKELAEYRERYRKKVGTLPTLTNTLSRIRMGYRTVKRHAPELYEKWNDESFYW